MKVRKRGLSVLLSLALICNLFLGVNFTAFGDVLEIKFADVRWDEYGSHFNDQPEDYRSEWDTGVGQDIWISAASVSKIQGETNVTSLDNIENFCILDADDNFVDETIAIIENCDRWWNNETNQWEAGREYDPGVYRIRFYAVGDYKVFYGEISESSYVTVHVDLPYLGLYNSNTPSQENLVALPYDEFEYKNDETYYLIVNQNMIDPSIQDIEVEFDTRLQIEENNICWKDYEYTPIEVKLPYALVGDYPDAILIKTIRGEYRYHEETQQNEYEEWYEECVFRFRGSQDGLVISGTAWDWMEIEGRNVWGPFQDNEADHFHKDWTTDLGIECYVTLGIKEITNPETGEYTIRFLDSSDLQYLDILDEYGENANATIDVAHFSFWDEGENREYVSNSVFSIKSEQLGNLRLRYSDGEYDSLLQLNCDYGHLAIYGQPIVDDSYCLGSKAYYNDERHIFYILVSDRANDWDEWIYTIRKGSKVDTEGDLDNISVTTDKQNGIITVEIAPQERRDIEIRVYYTETHHWDYDDNKGIFREEEVDNNREDVFVFSHTDEELDYSDEAEEELEVIRNVINLIDILPSYGYITVEDEEDIYAAENAYNNLTDRQKQMISDYQKDKLETCLSELEDAIDAYNIVQQDQKAVDDVTELINNLPDISELNSDEEIAEAISEAREAYDLLTDEQQDLLDRNLYAKLIMLERALPYAIDLENIIAYAEDLEDKKEDLEQFIDTLEEDINELEAANGTLEENNALLNQLKETLEAAKAISESGKKEIPKVGDNLTSGNATYKVLKAGSDTTMGTVEFTKINKSARKVVIPSTITVDGYTYQVTKIAANAFKGDKQIRTLIISEGITQIGNNSFNGCKNLKKITVKSTVLKKVGKGAFKKISKKVKVKVPADKKKKYKKLFKKGGIKSNRVK